MGGVFNGRNKAAFEEFISLSDQISFVAKSVWSDSDINSDYLDTGFEFVEIDEEDVDRISVLIQSQSFRD